MKRTDKLNTNTRIVIQVWRKFFTSCLFIQELSLLVTRGRINYTNETKVYLILWEYVCRRVYIFVEKKSLTVNKAFVYTDRPPALPSSGHHTFNLIHHAHYYIQSRLIDWYFEVLSEDETGTRFCIVFRSVKAYLMPTTTWKKVSISNSEKQFSNFFVFLFSANPLK